MNTQRIKQKILGGGLFAVMETRAYRTLAGVLEIIHRWIVSGETFILDDSRQWFAQYQSAECKSI
jgi:AraC family transcriptional regulator